ncbi:DUF11 domain-containing protein [Kaistella jeonii]|uniref:DUF11 domain-containing protein n=1 Tax=Kaistella jeonii TaxID=266749 RepID=UPI00068D08DD|nr:DUF11 domain-containing protein [Kaistella jeonii]SFC41028.1 conserved repeat domain-containing protein [Kaistella jeonii]VEI97403.1 Cysteine-rich outer membrane protein [Kaistella jeonii]
MNYIYQNILQKSIFLFAFLSMLSANAQFYSLDANGIDFSFTNANTTRLSGTQSAAGSVYKIANLGTVEGRLLYGKLTIVALVNASLSTFDDDTTVPVRFQPVITTTASGYVHYKLEFFDTSTNFPVYLRNYFLNGIDIDGNSAALTEKYLLPLNEYSNYTVSNASQLVISNIGSETQFRGIPGSLNGIVFENTASFYARYLNPKTSITFKIGATGAIANRQGAVALGSNGTFTGPTTPTNNPPSNIPTGDLAITKTADKASVAVGSNVVFAITATNNGPIAATNVNVNDKLPSGFTYVSSSVTPVGTTYNSGTGVWAIGNMANGASLVLKITATVNSTATNNAGITGDETESNTANNSASASVSAFIESDLQVTKSVDKISAPIGGNVAFTIIAKNNGAANNTNVKVDDLLPTGFTYDSHVAPAGTTYVPGTGVWTIGNLNNGATRTLKVYAKLNATGNYTNTAVISTTSGISDPNIPNNTSSASVAVVCIEQVLGETFTAEGGATKTFTQPPTNYGFVFDIFKLDNSFNMTINGTPLATAELQFQSSGTPAPGINVRFVDGTLYEVGTPNIYSFTGTAAAPMIRVMISPNGALSLFGSKVTNGPLFPLELFNGAMLNTITWNTLTNNVITITQNVVGVTNITGRGYGLNIIPCVCYDLPATGTGVATNHGITLLRRAGGRTTDWPMVRKSAHTVLESNTKGFVITRMTTTEIGNIISPQEGMMVFDTVEKCLKINSDGTTGGWSCFNNPTCP